MTSKSTITPQAATTGRLIADFDRAFAILTAKEPAREPTLHILNPKLK